MGMIRSFLPRTGLVAAEQPSTPWQGAQKRRHTRHRSSQNPEIIRGEDEYEAMTFEISEGGLWAATPRFSV